MQQAQALLQASDQRAAAVPPPKLPRTQSVERADPGCGDPRNSSAKTMLLKSHLHQSFTASLKKDDKK